MASNEESSHPNVSNEKKQCRSCTDFRSWMRQQSLVKSDSGKLQNPTPQDPSKVVLESQKSAKQDHQQTHDTNHKGPSAEHSVKHNPTNGASEEPPLWGRAAKEGCPADVLSLGRGSWRLLHTIAANYPDLPSPEDQQDMSSFIRLFSKVYPCPPCAQDFREWLSRHPPEVSSGSLLSQFFCRAHNEVNRKLGKEEFDCSLVDQRWKHGWSDGSCG